MPTITLKLRFDSPAFLNGSDPKGEPEFRVPSVRGQLRYWARAIAGAETGDLKALWERESAAFGSTGRGAPVLVQLSRVYATKDTKDKDRNEIESFPMLPHREYSRRNELSPARAIKPDTLFTLTCRTRPAMTIPPLFEQALAVWLLLGGIGKRSRRMFGSPGVRAVDPKNGFTDAVLAQAIQPWPSVDALAAAVKSVLNAAVGTPASLSRPPSFPTLHPAYSRIVIGRGTEFDGAKSANQALFGLLRDEKRPYRADSEKYFGHASRGRRASPLIAQVRKIGDYYHPVLTYLVSNDLPDLKIVNQFMDEAEKQFKGETVWGGAFR